MTLDLRVRPATWSDDATVMALLAEATERLAGRDTDRWQRTEHRRAGVDRDIGWGTLFLVLDGSVPVGTITVDELADTDFWRRGYRAREALYVHRMTVARTRAGEGIGSAMLNWAGRRALRNERRQLRLDAWRTNDDLHKYYVKQGFRQLRTTRVPGRGSGALFERPAGLQVDDARARIVARWTADRGRPRAHR